MNVFFLPYVSASAHGTHIEIEEKKKKGGGGVKRSTDLLCYLFEHVTFGKFASEETKQSSAVSERNDDLHGGGIGDFLWGSWSKDRVLHQIQE